MPTTADLTMMPARANSPGKSPEHPLAHHCFSLSVLRMKGDNLPDMDCSGLSAQQAQDLANCLPFLACGEESAVHAFSHSLLKDINPEEAAQMQAIAEDELRHAVYLENLRCALPSPDIHLPVEAMSRFFRRLLTRNSARHFAQVAALDLSVCRLLTPLLNPQAGLKNAPQVQEMLRLITRDEARHVKVARNMAARLGLTPVVLAEIELDMEYRLGVLLAPIRASLERLTNQHQASAAEPGWAQQ